MSSHSLRMGISSWKIFLLQFLLTCLKLYPDKVFESIYISKRSKIEKHCLSVHLSLSLSGLRMSSREAVGFLGFRICTQHDFLDLPLTCKHKITTGFFTENSVVVAEGDFQANGVFQVLLVLELQCIFSTYRFSISVQAPHCYA